MGWTILITARTLNEVGASALALLQEAGCQLKIPPRFGPYPAAELQPLLEGADAVLASMDQFTRGVLGSAEAKRLKIVSRWGVGYDAIDVPAATDHGVLIAYTPGLLNEAVADCAFGLLLCAARKLHLGHQAMSEGRWQPYWGNDVWGKTIGIIGCGRIGQAMARRARGFNLRVLGYDIAADPAAAALGIEFVGLDQLLAESDYVSLHAALTPGNRGLIGERELRLMKPSAFLINTARAGLVQDQALLRALSEGWIAGAALDAFTIEPLPSDNPFRELPNVLLTPHLASFARETGERVSVCAARAIVDLMQGRRPQCLVNPELLPQPQLRAALPPAPSSR
jgi:phosphoglycerate dehydrogenase-like enzyme